MYCKYCGRELPKGANHCTECGKEIPHTNKPSGDISPYKLVLGLHTVMFVAVPHLPSFGIRLLLGAPLPISFFVIALAQSILGLAIVLCLHGMGKIITEHISLRDLVFPVALYLTGCSEFVMRYFTRLIGDDAIAAAGMIFAVEDIFALDILWPWLLLSVFLMARSSDAFVLTRRGVGVMVGMLLLWSLALTAFAIPALFTIGLPEQVAWYVSMAKPYFLFLWLRRMVTFWFAVLCGRGALRLTGCLVFVVVVLAAAFAFGWLLFFLIALGMAGLAYAMTLTYIVGGGVLLAARRR